MQSGLYVGLSSQMALERRMTTIADNMANMNTVGFRATEVKFDQMLAKTRNDLNARIAFVSQGSDYFSTNSGGVEQTGNPLDVAIRGEAWFALDTPDGEVLTRDGRFGIREDGMLISTNGYEVLDAGGAAIQLDRGGDPPEISADGVISQGGNVVAQIGLFEANIAAGFLRYENSGIMTTAQAQPILDRQEAGIMQGFIEKSNVNGISQMTQLIQINRAFDSIASLLRDSESSFSEAIKTLGGSR